MVVLSSGTLGSPQILERSGVGNGDLLRQLGIKVVSNLPGVGEEYQDHYTTLSSELSRYVPSPRTKVYNVFIVFRVSNETITLDDFLRGDKDVQREVCFRPFPVSTYP